MSPLVALVIGVLLGGVVTAVVLLRARPRGAAPSAQAPGAPDAAVARRVLHLMDTAVVVLGADDAVLLANPAAVALGVVHGTRLSVPELVDLSHRARSGAARRVDVPLPGEEAGQAPRLVGAHAVRLSDDPADNAAAPSSSGTACAPSSRGASPEISSANRTSARRRPPLRAA